MNKSAYALALALITTLNVARADVPAVTADIAPVHSLVAQVMGNLGEPELTVSKGASPHGYSLRPSEARALEKADIVFWVSAGLTPWLADTIDTLSPNGRHVEMLEIPGSRTLSKRNNALFERHAHHDAENDADEHAAEADESHEKTHEASHDKRDPHAWLDPLNAKLWLDAIARELSAADPEHAQIYAANAESGKAEIKAAEADVNAMLDPVRGQSFIVFHDAYQYFENAFDFPAAGAIALGDATSPGAARIKQIQDRVKQAKVNCVLAEPQFNAGLVEAVLVGTEARSSEIDPLGSDIDNGPNLYPRMLRELASALAECV